MPIENSMSKGRYQFTGKLSKSEIIDFLKNDDVEVLQTSDVTDIKTYELLNEYYFIKKPKVQLRMYGFYKDVLDLSIVKVLTNVKNYSADCLMEVKNAEFLATFKNVDQFAVGIYKIENFDFLTEINPNIESLSLMASFSKKPKIDSIKRFENLKTLYLEGQQNGIQSISFLKNLEDITLRSISTNDLEYLCGLKKIKSVDIKLGGIKDFSALKKLDSIKYLELWQIRNFNDCSFISSIVSLQNLFMQNLPQITSIPDLSNLINLRRIYLENMKGLNDFSGVLKAPCLEEFCISMGMKQNIEDLIPILNMKSIKKVAGFLGSDKKNNSFKKLAQEKGLEEYKYHQFEYK